jgi:hypothetical protein
VTVIGNGTSPQESMDAYVGLIRGRTMTVSAGGQTNTYLVPPDLQ